MHAQIGTVKTDRFAMDYCRFGSGEGTLVILTGLSVQSVMPAADAIAEQYKLLTDAFTVYVFDRKKGPLPVPYTIEDMALDTAEALEALGLGAVEFFGASQGGMMAMELAINRPELVHKLILGSSSACVGQDQFGLFDSWIQLAKAGKTAALYLSFGEALYPREIFEGVKDAWLTAAESVTAAELARFVALAEGLRDFDITEKLERIRCPVLVIGSRRDAVLGGSASEQLAEGLRGSADCQLYMYDGYGHAVYDCAPDYTQRMLRFLTA